MQIKGTLADCWVSSFVCCDKEEKSQDVQQKTTTQNRWLFPVPKRQLGHILPATLFYIHLCYWNYSSLMQKKTK